MVEHHLARRCEAVPGVEAVRLVDEQVGEMGQGDPVIQADPGRVVVELVRPAG